MKRLENGLIEGLEYIRDEISGRIDWLKMIPKEYLYINQDKRVALEKRLNKPFNEITIDEVKDIEKVITLQGIRYLLDLRGYKNVKMTIDVATPEYVAATCDIEFLPNEEENFSQSFPGSASAHINNTKSFYRNYLVEAATNRALCRAVRNFLKINIVSKEELSDAKYEEEETVKSTSVVQPADMLLETLNKLMKEKSKNFDWLKTEFDGNWAAISDIPKPKLFEIIGALKKLS